MAKTDDSRRRQTQATLVGATALLMWSCLAVLATLARRIPPFELVALTFGFAFALSCGLARWAGGWLPLRDIPRRAWVIGVGGLFGYHFVYFLALRAAPPVHVNLLNYLWPLFVVVFAAFLPGERLRWWHGAGAALGFAGAAVLVSGGGTLAIEGAHLAGYALALFGAMMWAGYSVASRRLGAVPTRAVGYYCGVTAVLALLCHGVLETWLWPGDVEWAVIAALGVGPVGAAFFAWDHGVKRGDLRSLAAMSYAVPLLGALLLAAAGLATLTVWIGVAAALIVGGAALASRDLWRG